MCVCYELVFFFVAFRKACKKTMQFLRDGGIYIYGLYFIYYRYIHSLIIHISRLGKIKSPTCMN